MAPPFVPEEDELSAAYESMIRGGTMPTEPRNLRLMRLMQDSPFYGPSQGIAGPVPRGTPPEEPYGTAMGSQEQAYGPIEPAVRVPESGIEESRYHQIVDQYLQSLQEPYRLPEPAPYSRREKLAMLAAREPWQREMIVRGHEEPYQRALAEAQIGQRRSATAAGLASDLEKSQAYERYRLARAGQPSQQLDYVDKIEKAQAEVGNVDWAYTRPHWKALAQFKAQTAAGKLPATKEAAIEDLERELRADEGRFMQATSDPIRGFMPETELEGERGKIVREIPARREMIKRRIAALAGMTPDIYRKFRNLTAEQQEEVIRAYEKRMAGEQGTGQLGPVAPQPSYYP